MSINHEVSLKSLVYNRYGPEYVNKLRNLERIRKKCVITRAAIVFLTKCRDLNVIPTCVRIAPRKDIFNSEKVLRVASVKLLRQLIRSNRYVLDKVQCQLLRLHLECSAVFDKEIFDTIDRVTYLQAQRTADLCEIKHERKLKILLLKQRPSIVTPDIVNRQPNVINLSNEVLPTAALSALEKGLNFAISPSRIPFEKIIGNIEEVIFRNKLPTGDAENMRQDVAVLLRRSKCPSQNITPQERSAILELRHNNDVLVLKADKGNATVIMNVTDYEAKIDSLLSDVSTYKKVNYNPTARVTRKTIKLIQDNRNIIGDDVSKHLLQPRNIQPPKLYGLPKIHKKDVPLRPIVSQIDSPTYELAKHVTSVLQPLVGRTSTYVKDSRHFVSFLTSTKLKDHECMLSFDVESLYTNVPIDECVEVIKRKLEDNNIPAEYIVLLQHCLNSNFFLYKGQYYLQIDGVAMGSPVAPVVANLWMEFFENQAISTAPLPTIIWKRYVDDVFSVLQGGKKEVEQYLAHLNSIHTKMTFTYELEEDRALPFLDVLVHVRSDGSFGHSVYRKQTHTDRYLHGSSHHHPRHLASVATTLINRAHDLCDDRHVQGELEHVRKVLHWNGHAVPSTEHEPRRERVRHLGAERQKAYLPFVKGVTDRIGTLLQKYYNIKTVFTPFQKMSHLMRSPKDRLPFQCPGVYKIDCSCGSSYIGQTKRPIATRVTEHIKAVRHNDPQKSAIAEHILQPGTRHWIELHKPQVLSTERHYIPRLVREAIEIRKHQNFNREDGFKLPSMWNPVVEICKPGQRRNNTNVKSDTVSVVCRTALRTTASKRTRKRVDRYCP